MKKQFLFMVAALTPFVASAQLVTQDASNSTAVVVRDPVRQASTDVDAVVYNPAGMAFMKNGFHVSLNGNGSYALIPEYFLLYEGELEEGTVIPRRANNTISSIIPSLQLSYKKDKWAVGLSIANEGGFGHWNNPNGNMSATSALLAAAQLKNIPLETLRENWQQTQLLGTMVFPSVLLPNLMLRSGDRVTFVHTDFNSNLYSISPRLMASYKILPNLSVAGGIRVNRVLYNTSFYYNENIVERPSTQQTMKGTDYFEKAAENLKKWSASNDAHSMENAVSSAIEILELNSEMMAISTPLISLNLNGWGITPVLGVDYQAGNVNIGAKYELKTKIKMEGENGFNFNIPSTLSLGADWSVNDKFNFAFGSTMHLRTKGAFADNAEEKSLFGGEVAISGTWSPNTWLSLSAAQSYILQNEIIPNACDKGLGCEIPFDGSFPWGKTSFGFSFGLSENLHLNVGYNLAYSNSVLNVQIGIIEESALKGERFFEDITLPNAIGIYKFIVESHAAIGLNYSF